ncbi:hypothetical protein N7499_001924 [Penicillium canescens]|uniref:Calcineurin-like phosphoesterase domain-containing protein n=1 Tax=Penicillium canescens TaxID=5083 RepID=A0AAD6N606_PENCN|nr:uncharacterized protein N7446_009458 [Penicillium canescens]KAJ6002211.1 hypothetical protein N7522_007438 [Penicillium canescens]KAJ6034704.1 hypothetical protein N7460_008879 [Penicillium canescens]KAJ6046367.1 hypothetical protein N7444_007621 [Penicillium canescens]KAJ6053446.1 hypothetical protein N7446_009458 [Penicillium canescens]KAJ6097550.1 hypothetical protein N7499_001924 [Penicillium canescens]
MQPGALDAVTKPKGPLNWGQINFIHTSDTHGWLEGHIKERNYGADWGDFVSFTKHMQDKAAKKKVDLLLIDTGDLHDGNGLSDATTPNGNVTNPIFENIDYDLLTPGNHELIASDVAYNTFTKFTKVYGDKYLTSNIDICKNCQNGEPDKKEWVSMGSRSKYITTKHGLRIMAFGVILDGTNNNKNMTRIQTAAEMVKQDWFKNAVNRKDIDLFVLIGHNPVKPGIPKSLSTFPLLMDALRKMRPEIPVQGFGGHTHRRDFYIYDPMSSAMESGKYCDTVGWLSLDGIKSQPNKTASPEIKRDLDNKSIMVESADASCNKTKAFDMKLTRRYLDWNRLTFDYHATGSQNILDTSHGLKVTKGITDSRKSLNLTFVYGCAPQSYCVSCKPFGDKGNVYTLVQTAAAATVVNPDRSMKSRMIIVNKGAIRYDLVQGPFTLDDSYIVCPYTNTFRYFPDVPYSLASKVLETLNKPKSTKRSSMTVDTISSQMLGYDECDNPSPHNGADLLKPKSLFRRVLGGTTPTPGYTTCDDLGNDGDDTPHSQISEYSQPDHIQATAGFPSEGQPDKVDIVFSDFLGDRIVGALNLEHPSKNYTTDDSLLYMPENFTSNTFIPAYASMAWKDNINNCSIAG